MGSGHERARSSGSGAEAEKRSLICSFRFPVASSARCAGMTEQELGTFLGTRSFPCGDNLPRDREVRRGVREGYGFCVNVTHDNPRSIRAKGTAHLGTARGTWLADKSCQPVYARFFGQSCLIRVGSTHTCFSGDFGEQRTSSRKP